MLPENTIKSSMFNDIKMAQRADTRMNACMVAYTFYESDNRVRRYAETLAGMGHQVDAVVLRKPGQPRLETIKGVAVHRIQERKIDERSPFSYLVRLLKFFVLSFIWISRSHMRKRYKLVHVHSVPDFEIFAAMVPKAMGALIILDIHDLVPEFYADKFKVSQSGLLVRLLKVIERMACAFADHVIIANHLWYDKLTSRSLPKQKCTVVLNYPSEEIFKRKECVHREDDRMIMIYPGTLAYHQGIDVAINACISIRKALPSFEFHIYGKGPEQARLHKQIQRLNLAAVVKMHDPVPLEEIALRMAMADIGVVPKRASGFGGEAFSTKILEFMAMGVPVVASRTKIDEYYFSNGTISFFDSEDSEDLAGRVIALMSNPDARERQITLADAYVSKQHWKCNQHTYLNIIKNGKTHDIRRE